MALLFGIDIAALVNTSMGAGLQTVTLRKKTGSVRSSNPTETVLSRDTEIVGKGFLDEISYLMEGTQVPMKGDAVSVLGASLNGAVPAVGDYFQFAGSTVVWEIIGPVKTDPAQALYTCSVRSP
jgi:hypothetical protein